ncbi:MAG: glycosyltransferase [Candidatus Abyssobacteria bacterium SURF_17]|uniref:Glycosyltransferase n=1 Tax=Candidatus Abyssobacteria bacterium SURF_17 TaxID=2093361 RepID=A0A419F385_9BACT|nr:MAG: glycosyltransferase [Candidatus Abyssubacteria bacterium SURF_17]
MSVYNETQYLRSAIDSVLAQTFPAFEFLIVDDGSCRGTKDILATYTDRRIRVFVNRTNIGLTRSLNLAISQARGKYITRLDSDDISYPSRLQRQFEFLETHPDYSFVGTQCAFLDPEGRIRQISKYPCSDEEIKKYVWKNSPFSGASVMCVKHDLVECGGYRELFQYAQDYDLWLRVTEKFNVANLADVLYGIRYHRRSITLQKFFLQSNFAELARRFALMRAETGSDLIMRGEFDRVKEEIASWHPDCILDGMRIRSASALKLLEFIAPWGRLSDVFSLWLTSLFNNPLDQKVWNSIVSGPVGLRLKKMLKGSILGGGNA